MWESKLVEWLGNLEVVEPGSGGREGRGGWLEARGRVRELRVRHGVGGRAGGEARAFAELQSQHVTLRTLVAEAGRKAILRQAGQALAVVDRGELDAEAGVLWVLASGRGEIAQGPSSGDVGLMTQVLMKVLQDHPGEPWWAVMDRLWAEWSESSQSPGLAGAEPLIPLSGSRLERPDEWLPCVRTEGATPWQVELADAVGWLAGQSVVLTSSLAIPALAHGTLARGPAGLEVRVAEHDGGSLTGQRFAWACRRSLASTTVVELWGGNAIQRGDVASLLEGSVMEARDLGSSTRATPEQSCIGLEVDGNAVIVRDRWGDAVARTSLDDPTAWLRWIDRLAAIDDWLAVESSAKGWPHDAFALRWGTWSKDGQREEWAEPTPVVSPETSLWIELEARMRWLPAYVGAFRIRADREVEVLTRHVPGGLLVTERYSVAGLGQQEPLRLAWPGCDGRERTERLVVMISDRPLSFATLARRGMPGEQGLGWPERTGQPAQPRVSLRALRYRLRR
jgi:hypothetical protein